MKNQAVIITAFLTFATSHTFASARHCVNPSELTVGENVKIKFCDVREGQGVLIGSERGDLDEKPVKPRNFKRFQMSQFEVTQLQFKTVNASEPWKENDKVKLYAQEGDDFPASYISWNDAQEFVRILNLIDKTAIYRLPTEAEFEYAARAGTKTNYFWGEGMETSFAFFWGNTENNGKYAHKVNSCPSPLVSEENPGYCANQFGLYHMLGNVAEWTADDYKLNYSSAPEDGHQAVKGVVGSERVIRGGGWDFQPRALRSANRESRKANYRSNFVGFRVVRIAK